MLYHTKTGQIKIDDTYMDYFSFGSGERNLIMIQGLSTRGIKGAALSFAYQYRMFAKEFRVYVIDRRHEVPEGFSVWDIANDIFYAMNELGIEHTSLYGVSQGGMIAQAMAVIAPERIDKAVLGVMLSRPNETIQKAVDGWISYAQKGDYESINRETFTMMYSENYLKKYRLLLPLAIRMSKPENLEKFSILAKACTTFDVYDQLDKITCPVFVIGSAPDQITSGAASEEIAKKLNCPIYMYEDYGHAVYDEIPDFNRRVLEFLR